MAQAKAQAQPEVEAEQVGEGKPADYEQPRGPKHTLDTLWQCGDKSTPVRTEIVGEIVSRHSDSGNVMEHFASGRMPGPTRAARNVIRKYDPSFFVADPRAPGPLPNLRPARTCWELHPGLCITRDASILDIALHIQTNCNTLFSGHSRESLLGRFFRLEAFMKGPEADDHSLVGPFTRSVLLGDLRFTAPAVQFFVHCSGHAHMAVRLQGGKLDIQTSYATIGGFLHATLSASGLEVAQIHHVMLVEKCLAPLGNVADPSLLCLGDISFQALGRECLIKNETGSLQLYPQVLPANARRKRSAKDALMASGDELDAGLASLARKDREASLRKWSRRLQFQSGEGNAPHGRKPAAFKNMFARDRGEANRAEEEEHDVHNCLLYTSPSPRD